MLPTNLLLLDVLSNRIILNSYVRIILIQISRTHDDFQGTNARAKIFWFEILKFSDPTPRRNRSTKIKYILITYKRGLSRLVFQISKQIMFSQVHTFWASFKFWQSKYNKQKIMISKKIFLFREMLKTRKC